MSKVKAYNSQMRIWRKFSFTKPSLTDHLREAVQAGLRDPDAIAANISKQVQKPSYRFEVFVQTESDVIVFEVYDRDEEYNPGVYRLNPRDF